MTANASPPGSLAVQLRRANHAQLLALVEAQGRQLQMRHLRQILLNPYCDRRIIEEILCIRPLMSLYEARAALCRYRHTPEAAAMRHVAGLFWRDQAEICRDSGLHPGLRRLANRYLLQRLPRLSTGEKMALARLASPSLLSELSRLPDKRILMAVLENPRLTTDVLRPLAADAKVSPRHLELLANHPRWGRPYEIRAALGRNPQAPFRVLFSLLPDLQRDDLEEIAQLQEHSSVITRRAREILQERWPRRSASGSTPGTAASEDPGASILTTL